MTSPIPLWKDLTVKQRMNKERRWNLIANTVNEALDLKETVEEVVEPTTRTISITVDDGTDAIQGATVVIGEVSKTTGSAGGCSFTEMTDGEKSVTVTKEGYTDKTETITVSENYTSFTISLTATVPAGET